MRGLQVGEGKEREGEGGWGHFTPLFGAQADHGSCDPPTASAALEQEGRDKGR